MATIHLCFVEGIDRKITAIKNCALYPFPRYLGKVTLSQGWRVAADRGTGSLSRPPAGKAMRHSDVKLMIGKLFEVYDEAVGLGEDELACVLQWVITAYAKRRDIPIGADAFERHVVETAANHRRASIEH